MSERLVRPTVKDLRPLRMRGAFRHDRHALNRFDQLLTILRTLIACIFHARLDRVQSLPASEHVGVGRYVLAVGNRGAIVIDAHRRAIGFFMRRLVRLRIARHAFPEIGAFEVLEARRRHVDRLKAVDKAEDLRPRRAKELAQFFHEGQNAGADHDVIDHFGLAGDFREVFGERRLGRWDRDMLQHLAALRFDGGGKEIAVVVAERKVREDHRDLLAEVLADKRRHRRDLRLHVRDARLHRPAVQGARGDVMAFGDDEIRQLQFTRSGG